jgi:large subunit ribosomal protein L28e
MSSALVWQIVRSNNCFTRKGMQGELFSAEKGNLYNKHSYKYSGASTSAASFLAGA